MSPLSVAQYFPPGRLSFDLVVIDEASQVPPQEAIGIIARGRQMVAVGVQGNAIG
jgi:superfamily I DNA and/or RNA helicase